MLLCHPLWVAFEKVNTFIKSVYRGNTFISDTGNKGIAALFESASDISVVHELDDPDICVGHITVTSQSQEPFSWVHGNGSFACLVSCIAVIVEP